MKDDERPHCPTCATASARPPRLSSTDPDPKYCPDDFHTPWEPSTRTADPDEVLR